MESLWTRITLSSFQPIEWLKVSYVHRLVGLLKSWQESSWLLKGSEGLSAFLIMIILAIAPFASTNQIGVLLVAVALCWGLMTLVDKTSSGVTVIHITVLVYGVTAVLATVLSPMKKYAIGGLLEFSLYLFLFLLSARVFRSTRWVNWIFSSYLLSSLIVGCYGVRQKIFGAEPLATWNDPTSTVSQATRVYSYLGNPNLLAGYLLGSIALSASAIFVWKGLLPKLLAGTIFTINLGCVVFTGSRGGVMGLLTLITVYLLLLKFWYNGILPKFWQQWLLPTIFSLIGGIFFLAFIAIEPVRVRVLSIFAGRGDSSNNFRINVWEAVYKMIADRPIVGIGPGHDVFNKMYPLYMKPNYTALSSYSIWLEHLVELGVIGFTAFLWLILVTINQGITRFRAYIQDGNMKGLWLISAISVLVAMMIHGFVDTVWYRPQVNMIWWLMIAFIASQNAVLTED